MRVVLGVAVWLGSACADDGGSPAPGSGSGGVSGTTTSAAAATSSAGGSTTVAAGGGSGGEDSGAAGGTGGAAGGSVDASVEDGGGADALGDATNDAPPVKRFVCPPGPFAKPIPGQAQAVCAGFRFNYTYNEGPTWIPSQGAFFFSNFSVGQPTGGDVIRYVPGGACEVFLRDVGCNGLGLSPSGNLMAACHQSRSVVEFDVVTKTATTLADMYMGKMFDSPNDLVAHSTGSIYFTNPNYELGMRTPGIGPALFWRDPTGALTLVKTGAMNGVTLSADERTLYVVGGGAWDLDAAGRPSNNRASFANGDGIATDCDGNVYSSNGTITSPQGQSLGTFQRGTNLAFGGTDGKILLVVGSDTNVRSIQMNLPGFP
jgi:gluconolactonase